MKNRFYLACFRDNVGSNVAFHGKNGLGYHTDVEKAHEYTLEEAQKAWNNGRKYDQPISADHVDKLIKYKIDFQYIDKVLPTDFCDNEWVAYETGRYNGNDLFWLTDDPNGISSLDYSLARSFSTFDIAGMNCNVKNVRFVSKKLTDRIKRKTFDFSLFNKKVMVQGAGLITPKHIIKQKRRVANPKIRWNCPSCGRISWQYNPHDFDKCSNLDCELGWEHFLAGSSYK